MVGTLVFAHYIQTEWTGAFEQSFDFVRVEVTITRIDPQEEPVVGGAIELGIGEHRIAELGQAVEQDHRDDRRESTEENRALEHHRNEGRQREVWFARDDVLVADRIHPVLHDQSTGQTGQAKAQHDPWQYRWLDTERFIDTVHRERRKSISAGITGVTDLAARLNQLSIVRVLRHPTVRSRWRDLLFFLWTTHIQVSGFWESDFRLL